MGSDALEQALALLHSPAQRFTVRARPLAEGIEQVIQLAPGGQPALGQTASRLGLTDADLLEAVRFYLQQTLFEAEPDAYRTLGVAADAAIDRIHRNYRELQRWLHPDRRGTEWEALYASRLNWAWSQLRDARARQRYDAQRNQSQRDALSLGNSPGGQAAAWTAIALAPARTPAYFIKRAALALSLLSCAGLLYLALVRQDAMRSVNAGDATATHWGGAQDLRVPAIAVERSPSASAAVVVKAVADSPAPALAPQSRSPAKAALAPPPSPILRLPGVQMSAADLRPPTPRLIAAVPDLPSALPQIPPPAARISRSAPSNSRLTTHDASAASTPADAAISYNLRRGAHPIRISPERAEPPVSVLRRTTSQANASAATVAPHSRSVSGAARQVSQPPRIAPPPPASSEAFAPAAAVASTLSTPELLARVGSARDCVRDLVAYIRGRDAADSAWRDAAPPFNARQARHALRQRLGAQAASQFALDPPRWRLSGNNAALEAGYHVSDAHRLAEHGHFRVDMAWHGQAWQLEHVELEPQP